MSDWEEDKIDLPEPSPGESYTLSSSLQHEEKAKKMRVNLIDKLLKNMIINKELLKKYFGFQNLISMQKELYKAKSKDKNNNLVNMIKNALRDLKKDIKKWMMI